MSKIDFKNEQKVKRKKKREREKEEIMIFFLSNKIIGWHRN